METIDTILKTTRRNTTQRTTDRTFDPPKVNRWQLIEPLIRDEIEQEGIELVPRNLAEILAKINTNETAGGKGIFLLGPTGTGKTRRLEIASRLFGIEIISAKDLVRKLQNTESEFEEKEILLCNPYIYETPEHYHDLIIDDLGIETEEQMIYGTRRNLMVDAIYDRHKVFTDGGRRWKTHFTSNLTKDEIRARYGERIWSRLNEMCVFVTLNGKDRRMMKVEVTE